jgi:Fic family protein
MNIVKKPIVDFGHPLVTLVVELEKLRETTLNGTTPANMFFLIKRLFHLLESVGSARIEGNNTTIAQYIIENEKNQPTAEAEEVVQISNIDSLLTNIDEMGGQIEISDFFIRQLHSYIVKGLVREGSKNPGAYRTINVQIAKSQHIPPDYTEVNTHMEQLVTFINNNDAPQYDLIKIAVVHHAFAWIHPFDNGNGRVVRALTYALMLKYGFRIDKVGRVMNPVAVFCANRNKYYDMLQKADDLSNDGLITWCTYVLEAVKSEYNKTLKLTDYTFVFEQLMKPAVKELNTLGIINNSNDLQIIEMAIAKDYFKKADIIDFCTNDKAATRKLSELKEKKLIIPLKDKSKLYKFNLSNSLFLRLVATSLAKEGFLPEIVTI